MGGNSDSEEPEEDPEELLEEDPEEDSETEPEEDPETEPEEDSEELVEEDSEEIFEEDPEEETEERLEEDPEELVEEDPEEDTEEQLKEDPEVEPEEVPEVELSKEPEKESAVECVTLSLSCHNNDETEQLIEDPDEDPSEEDVSDSSSDSGIDEADQNCLNVKKRLVDATAFESVPCQNFQSKEKCEHDESASFKQPEQDGETGEGDGNCKKRKNHTCPQWQSTLKAISCDKCGSFGHPTSSCLLTASPQVSNPLWQSSSFCSVRREQGHKTLKATSCRKCGSFGHPTSCCLLSASPRVSNPLWHSSGPDFGSTPNIINKSNKAASDVNLYVGFLPQSVDDNRLRELFSPFGKIIEAKVIKDQTTSLSTGGGFVKFENPNDMAVAVMHMNGYQMDGKTLLVWLAEHPPFTGSSAFSHLPVYPRPAEVSQSVPSQAGPPAFMLPEARLPFLKSEGLGSLFASTYSGHGNHLPKFGVTNFSNPSVVSSHNKSKNAFSSPALLVQFPGDPDYPGSKF